MMNLTITVIAVLCVIVGYLILRSESRKGE